MIISEALAQEFQNNLPSLRRYARALLRSEARGDEAVTAALETAIARPDAFDARTGRVGLYALVNRICSERRLEPAAPGEPPIEQAMAKLDEIDRRVYLLVGLERLTAEEAAAAVGISAAEAAEALERAQEAMRQALTARILLVEDEALVALDLAETIAGMGHAVIGTASYKSAALDLAERERPTLVLMDIRLAQGDSGIETALELKSRHGTPIIFVTGYAGDLERLDLTHLGPVVAKPFTHETIRRAVSAAVFARHPD